MRSAGRQFQIVGAAWQNARLPKTVTDYPVCLSVRQSQHTTTYQTLCNNDEHFMNMQLRYRWKRITAELSAGRQHSCGYRIFLLLGQLHIHSQHRANNGCGANPSGNPSIMTSQPRRSSRDAHTRGVERRYRWAGKLISSTVQPRPPFNAANSFDHRPRGGAYRGWI